MTAVVTGASRGLGKGIATALVDAGIDVVGVARTPEPLQALAAELGPAFTPVVADARQVGDLMSDYRPSVVVLNAGASPVLAPIHEQTWEGFATCWETDTRQGFEWIGAALRLPLAPGSVVVTVSSGAALRGSPLSGGYAGAKSALRFIASYAAQESARLGLRLRFVTLLPQLTPVTGLGAEASAAYAQRQGVSPEEFSAGFAPVVTPEVMGAVVLDAISGGPDHVELLVTGAGARPL